MGIDVSTFGLHNVSDTCAVWNVLSSRRLHSAAAQAGVCFICTRMVVYECLLKPRQKITDADLELQARLVEAQKTGSFSVYPLDIDDLQTVEILENRKRLGKGELSSIAFAMKIGQAVLTDDQKARKLASEFLTISRVQTTPHLLGWLFFTNGLSDHDKDMVIEEHLSLQRPLKPFFQEMYMEACRCRLMAARGTDSND